MTDSKQVLLFDLGGVLIESNMFSELGKLMSSEKSVADLVEMWLQNELTREFELGRCSADEFSRSVVSEFNLSTDPNGFLVAFRSWVKGFNPNVEPMLAELRRDYIVCCLSNSNEVHWPEISTHQFHHAFSSHLIGCIKPDKESFDYVLDAIGAQANNVHFFDDALLNVNAARQMGINAYHTPGFSSVETQLKQLGFLH